MPKPQWHGLLKHMQRQNLLPAVVFLFSKKRCEEVAHSLGGVQVTPREPVAFDRRR